ncbi:hypothetical protein EYZ11_006993 [Aspergillus tanneri]|uniref:Uncharacterized protein n=1 Tax=Aspergillus tanneri TaxID=1220188 RepID=A0A4S3JE36_9EURO|nr:hypothetical protein EYZ11_006993 [Aspergillus tanneri]
MAICCKMACVTAANTSNNVWWSSICCKLSSVGSVAAPPWFGRCRRRHPQMHKSSVQTVPNSQDRAQMDG